MSTEAYVNQTEADDYYYYYYDPYWTLTPAMKGTFATLMGILIFLVIVGNILTLVSYIIDKKLHTVYDFFIFNLAFTDFLIGAFSMPIYARATLVEFEWEFGKAFCKTWLCVDLTLCALSIPLIILLSYDRLQLVTLGAEYSTKVTIKMARIQVAVSWAVAFLIYGPAELLWDHIAGYSIVAPGYCDYEFSHNIEFTTVTAVLEFVIPIVGLGIFNFLIYRQIRKRTMSSKRTTVNKTLNSTAISVHSTRDNCLNDKTEQSHTASCTTTAGDDKSTNTSKAANESKGVKSSRNVDSRLKRDTKAAKMLASIVLVFLITWAPFTLTSIIIAVCKDVCVNENVYEMFGWLLWSKSAINPFLYAFNSSRYKYNFTRIVFFWKKHNQIHPLA